MKIEIRNNSIVIDGYVNAVARDSKPIPSREGEFIEQVIPKTFEKALYKAKNVDLLLNHNDNRKLGSTTQGNLELFEDNIGLRAICTITDNEVIAKAKSNKLRGWSFGFYVNQDRWEYSLGLKRRYLEDIDLLEVSIIDDTESPAYIATSIEMRNNKKALHEIRIEDANIVITNNQNNKEYELSKRFLEDKIKQLRGSR